MEKTTTFLDFLQKAREDGNIVELDTDTKTVSGKLSVVGTDFVGILSSIERTVEETAVSAKGEQEKQSYITVYEIETFLRFCDIKSFTKVLRTVVK